MKGTSIIIPNAPSLNKLRSESIKIAKEIGYDSNVIDKISKAMGQSEINRILVDARHEWDVDPGRWFDER